MYVPRAMYSLRMSFWIVPLSLSRAIPRSSATTMYIASSVAAVALIVIDVDTVSSGMLVEQHVHVLDRIDRHAHAPDFAERARRVGVDAHLRRQVERDARARSARLRAACRKRSLVSARRAEAGVLAHRPEPAAIHRRLHAARERKLARVAEIARVVQLRIVRDDIRV